MDVVTGQAVKGAPAAPANPAPAAPAAKKKGPRRFVGRKKAGTGTTGARSGGGSRRPRANQVPQEILDDPQLKKDAALLPANYNFEIFKSVWKVRQAEAKCVALQFPEGLLLYSCVISDIIEKHTGASTLVMGDVTYGACCVDDLGAAALGADFMIHYGHSCLVPIMTTTVKMLYVFVDILIDVDHMVECVKLSFGGGGGGDGGDEEKGAIPRTHLAVLGTIQFAPSFRPARERLLAAGFPSVFVPQARPLSGGEVLGCTSPNLRLGAAAAAQRSRRQAERAAGSSSGGGGGGGEGGVLANASAAAAADAGADLERKKQDEEGAAVARTAAARTAAAAAAAAEEEAGRCDAYIFVADGRFHLESVMISNPGIPAFRYDPYSKKLTREEYDIPRMHSLRQAAIERARGARKWGVILGTLGRQGNPAILRRVEAALEAAGKEHFVLLLTEIFPAKLALFDHEHVDAWVQIACPRLSVDWGAAFGRPLLSAYEFFVAVGRTEWKEQYPMDFYAKGSGPWTNYHEEAAGKAEKA